MNARKVYMGYFFLGLYFFFLSFFFFILTPDTDAFKTLKERKGLLSQEESFLFHTPVLEPDLHLLVAQV